jgi:hypothetical protein
LIFACELG